MEEIRPPFDERSELRPPASGCRFGLRGMFVLIALCASILALNRLLPYGFIYIGIAFLAVLSLLSFAVFGLRD